MSIRVVVGRPQRGGGVVVVNGNGGAGSSALTRPTERRVQRTAAVNAQEMHAHDAATVPCRFVGWCTET